MRTGLQKLFILSGVILVMGGCGDESAQVGNQIGTLEESSLQQDLQTLINYEDQLQEDFEDSLGAEDLSNFTESSAAVFSNVDTRSTTLESLTETASTYEEVYQELQEISFSEDNADIENIASAMTENIGAINSSMESFIPQYETVLNNELEYFNSLGEESTDYENFTGGLENVNEQHESLNDIYNTLNESMTNLNENKDQALEIISEEGES